MSAMQKTPWGNLPIAPRRAAAPVADLFALPENAALLLALVASCEGRAAERVLADAVAFYAEHKIGLAGLADASLASRAADAEPGPVPDGRPALRAAPDEFLRGGAAVARQPKSNEVARPSRAPANSHNRESEPGRQEVPSGLLPMPHAPP